MASDQNGSSSSVEVIIQGKQYKSIRAYKQEQIKSILSRSLSSYNLMEFTEDELYEMMKEVRDQQTTKRLDRQDIETNDKDQPRKAPLLKQQITKEEAQDLSPSQMQEMLNRYHKEHKGEGSILIDPEKVKSIIIKPQKQSEELHE